MVRVQEKTQENINTREQLHIDNQIREILKIIKGKLTSPMCLTPKEFY